MRLVRGLKSLCLVGCLVLLGAGICTDAYATAYVRKNKMFDIPQTELSQWGESWCAPTAVGNSFAWLVKEYNLVKLMKVNGTGSAMTAVSVIDVLGNLDMNTLPDKGTRRSAVEPAKKSYIKRHGYEGVITVESWVSYPIVAADGSLVGYGGQAITVRKRWLKEQYNKGQDVEFSVSLYELRDGKLYRRGGCTYRCV